MSTSKAPAANAATKFTPESPSDLHTVTIGQKRNAIRLPFLAEVIERINDDSSLEEIVLALNGQMAR